MASTQSKQDQYNPRFSYSDEIVNKLMAIQGACRMVDVLHLPPDAAFFMKYQAQRRSTRYSTAIEGNTLDFEMARRSIAGADRTPSQQQQEVRNYWRALGWLEEQAENNGRFTEEFIRRLHRIIIVRGRGRRGEMTEYRTGECPVVDNVTGEVVYAPPEPQDVPPLISALVAWRNSEDAARLPGPIRAGLLSYQFVAIHPFDDGNGRTARALATAELWSSDYMMRGFLSVEEYYFRDLQRYYASLAMDLPWNYYDREENYDLTPWLEYFVESMAIAAEDVRTQAVALLDAQREVLPDVQFPWERLSRPQQQLLMRLVIAEPESEQVPTFTADDVAEWFMIGRTAAHNWLAEWRQGIDDQPFILPASGGLRVTSWRLNDEFTRLVDGARGQLRDQE